MLKTTLLLLIAANQAEAIKLGQCCGGCDNKNDDDHEEDKVDSEDLALKASLPELTEANPELTQALPALAAALPDLAAVLPELENEFPALATALPVLSATLPNISTESSLPTSNHGLPEPSFIDDLFDMLDADSNDLIAMHVAKKKCEDWVPEKMDEKTAQLYWSVLSGTKERYGCHSYSENGKCKVSYEDVKKYISDEGYWQAWDGYWYKESEHAPENIPTISDDIMLKPEPIEESILVVDLFAMLDADSNDDIHMNAAEWKVTDWVPSKMTQQTADTYWAILIGTEERYGCIFMNGQDRCVVGFDEVAQYIEDEGYWQSPDDGYWYKDLLVSTQPVEPVDTIQSNYAFTVDCTQRNYADSIAFCESQLMSIASIHNQEDNDTILGMIQAQCGTGWAGAYIGAESDGAGNWSWNDGSAWDFVSPSNDGIRGVNETKIAFLGNSEWHDWATGQATHGVVCQDMMVSTMPVEPIVTAAPVEPIEVSAPVTNEPNYVYSVDCTMRNYANSVSYCESQGMTISTIHTREDNDTIHGLLQAQKCSAYTGAYRESAQTSWTWEDGSAWDWQNPRRNEMNGDRGNHESRLLVGWQDGKWVDYGTGSTLSGVICQDMMMSSMPVEPVVTTAQPIVESYIYTVDCTQRNYANSVSYCQSKGMTMATVHTREDNNTIQGLLQAQNCAGGYTGAIREYNDTWFWEDGSAWDFQNALPGDRNWISWDEARMIIAKDGRWNKWGAGEATSGVICMDTVVSTMPVEPVEVAEPVPYEIKITGTSAYRGAYNDEWHQIEDKNGRPQWKRSGNYKDQIYWDATRWVLRYSGYDQPAYVCNQDTMLPPKNGWVNARESGGAPTLHY